MSSKEPYIVAALSILSAYIVISILGNMNDGDITLGTITWTSFVLANIATWTRACARPQVVTSPMANSTSSGFSNVNSPNSSSMGFGLSTPDRKLKFKASGDERDWYAADNNAIKV